MGKLTILITVYFISSMMNSQEFMKKIQLKEGLTHSIKHDSLNINTLLQVYNEKAAAHLIGDMHLKIDNDEEPLMDFYIATNTFTKDYLTKIYKNYFFTFLVENNNKYLIIEQAQLGKAFALLSNRSSSIGKADNLVTLEITNYEHEWGYDASPEGNSENRFDDVRYTLKVTVKNVMKQFSFYSSEIKNNYTIAFEGYNIHMLSDKYKDSSSLIEMMINKKKEL